MITARELNDTLYRVRQEAIECIYDLLVEKDEYEFTEGAHLFIEDDNGSFLQDIYYAKKDTDVLYFTENEEDDYDMGYTFGDMSTETIVNLYSHLSWELKG